MRSLLSKDKAVLQPVHVQKKNMWLGGKNVKIKKTENIFFSFSHLICEEN